MPEQQSRFAAFITELRHRRVFRVAAVYAGVAFVIIQIIDGAFGYLRIPEWVGATVIILVLLGFPIAIGLAWAFDITEQGIVRTRGHSMGKPGTSNRALIGVAILAIIVAVWGWKDKVIGGLFESPIRSIAVLPFVNYSAAQGNEWFTDGVTEEIISQLSKISDLRVISSTSSMQYKGTGKSLKEIGDELGVAHLLEGNVRRAGDRVRIAAQLIDARTDVHLWSDEYDRVIEDIFAIQTDVAQQIAKALKAELLPEEKQRLEQRPTDNLEAYEFYLRGNDYLRRGSYLGAGNKSDQEQAVNMYLRAIALDPDFALVYAQLSNSYAALNFYHGNLPKHGEQAWQAVDQALRLDPDLPEAHLALGNYYNLVERDYVQALAAFATAREGLLSSSDLHSEIAMVQMRQGRWDRALGNFQQAVELDPRSTRNNGRLANIYVYLRQYPQAERVINRVISLDPHKPGAYADKAELALLWEGSTEKAQQVIREAATTIDPVQIMFRSNQVINNQLGWWRFGLLNREYDEVVKNFPETYSGGSKAYYYFSMAQLYDLTNQPKLSQAYYDSVRVFAENKLAANPQFWRHQAHLGLASAFLGRKEQAIKAGKKAMELLPISACHW